MSEQYNLDRFRFRVWDKGRQRMFDVNPHRDLDDKLSLLFPVNSNYLPLHYFGEDKKLYSELMQCTGLKDSVGS